jgi:hypothetical protein
MRGIVHRRRHWIWGLCLAAAVSGLNGAEVPTNTLPSADTLIKALAARAPADARLEKEMEAGYQFTHTRVHEEFNLKGKSKKREVEHELNDPAARKPAEEAQRAGAGRSQGTASKKMSADDAPDQAYERKDVIVTEDLMRGYEFTPLGREVWEGVPLLKVDFQPAASAPPGKGLLERFIRRMAGTIWVDESDFTVVRARFFLTEKFKVGAGVLGSVSAFECRFERGRTAEGVWYTRSIDWRLECREFLVNKIIEQRETWDDVLKVKAP